MDFKLLPSSDSDWARTSDPHPVKVVLSLLSYGIMISIY
jgi:hypothetical protein